MDPAVAYREKSSIQEYTQHNSYMEGISGSQGIQYGRGHISSITIRFMFTECRDQIYQSCNEEVFRLVNQALIMCEIVDLYTSRYSRVVCMIAMRTKNDRDNRRSGYEIQIEWPYPVEKLQSTRGTIQSNEQIYSQVSVT